MFRFQIKPVAVLAGLFLALPVVTGAQLLAYYNEKIPLEKRVSDLLLRLTLDEKAGLLGYQGKPITRLGIPAYVWWNEALHGVARAGKATVFPQAIGMAATFNEQLVQEVADVISTEARAKFNLSARGGDHIQYMGLTFWSPNINIFRDPRWGRGQETYGEDPFLTARMGAAFVKGMQGKDSLHLKTAATAKHFAVHSGPEPLRHSFNAVVDEKDLRETYLYAFRSLVDAKVEAVMCAYNRVNGEPCCTGETLLRKILRDEWGFKGHVVTDCWALDDIHSRHKVMEGPLQVTAAAVRAGVNMDCSDMLQRYTREAVEKGLVTPAELDAALKPVLRTMFKLGFFDPKASDPFRLLGEAQVNADAHRELARKAAQQGMVLLKNANNILPLDKSTYRSIMVIGPNAASAGPLLANYHGLSPQLVTFAEGITAAAGAGTIVQYEQGCDNKDTSHIAGVWAASLCDITVAVLGLNPVLEGEDGDAFLSDNGGDKRNLDLPRAQVKLLEQLKKNNKPLVVIVNAGGNVDLAAIEPYADAILLAWYPGEQGGNAAADILFGKVSPAGRLPITFYRSLNDLPPYEDYAMKGRTYRYYEGPVQYPFGFGMSYTTFRYAWKKKPVVRNSRIEFSIEVQNAGAMDGDEVVQAYIKYPEGRRMPMKELRDFRRVNVKKGGIKLMEFSIPVKELQKWDLETGSWKLFPGTYSLVVGGNSTDERLSAGIFLNSL